MKQRVAAALTWDGARCSSRDLPTRAHSFLGRITPAKNAAKILASGIPVELRICWVPVLQGGDGTLSPPFASETGKRVSFRLVRTVAFGQVLGAVYRRAP